MRKVTLEKLSWRAMYMSLIFMFMVTIFMAFIFLWTGIGRFSIGRDLFIIGGFYLVMN